MAGRDARRTVRFACRPAELDSARERAVRWGASGGERRRRRGGAGPRGLRRARSTPVHESTTRRALAKRHSGCRSTAGGGARGVRRHQKSRARAGGGAGAHCGTGRTCTGLRCTQGTCRCTRSSAPSTPVRVRKMCCACEREPVERRTPHPRATWHSVSLTTVNRTPGSGFMPNIRSTETCVWPPPTRTTSFSTGVACILFLQSWPILIRSSWPRLQIAPTDASEYRVQAS